MIHRDGRGESVGCAPVADQGWQFFAVCECASQYGRLSYLASYNVAQTGQFPAANSQTVVLRARFWPLESRRYVFRLEATDPNGQPLIAPMENEMSLERRGEDESPYHVVFELREPGIAEPGEYAFDLYLDDDFEGRVPLIVLPALL